ncbi:MAG: hypothetical protein R6W97_00720 [Thiobacillus sp.]
MTMLNCTHCFTHTHWLLRISLVSVFLYHSIGKFAGLGDFSAMMELPIFVATLVALLASVYLVLRGNSE